jgi:streptogramin lyase
MQAPFRGGQAVALLIGLLALPGGAFAAGPATEFSAGISPGAGPNGIAAGPDGNLWFTEQTGNRIGRITPTGAVTEFSTGITGNAQPLGITAGPDGNMWFTENAGDRIGRITPGGTISEFSTGIAVAAHPYGIAAGPDGNLWFTEIAGDRIGKITPNGDISESPAGAVTAGGAPSGIAPGPDGNLWFTETNGDRIGLITPGGSIAEFATTAGASPGDIAAGPDGNLWFTEISGQKIGRITTAGIITNEFSSGIAADADPFELTAGPDGNLWFTDRTGSRVGRVTTSGAITEFSGGISANASPNGIAAGPDGNLWFAENAKGGIGRIDTDVPAPTTGNLLRNPGFDSGTPGTSRAMTVAVPGWVAIPNFTEGLYGGTDLPPTSLADQIGGGRGFGWGGAHSPDKTEALQLVDVGREAVAIDDGRASVTLSGLLGGEGGQQDNARVSAVFLSASGDELGSVQIGPVTPADRGNQTTLLPRSADAPLVPGTRAVRVVATATNIGGGSDNGYFDNLSLTLGITPAPGPPDGGGDPGGGPPGSVPDTKAPVFLAARLTNRIFAVDSKATAETVVARAAAKKGTAFVYTLSEASSVRFKIERRLPGRRVGGKCVKPSPRNRRKKACVRYVKIGTFAQGGAAGVNRKKFSGRIGRRRLKPGAYRATLRARDPAGNQSRRKRLGFRVVRR